MLGLEEAWFVHGNQPESDPGIIPVFPSGGFPGSIANMAAGRFG
jgi:hypothetical protein